MTKKESVSPLKISKTSQRRFLELINRFKKARVLVVGDFILDQFIWGKVDRISPEAPVPVVHVQKESYMPGGSLNVANNIHVLEGTVFPCGVVGRDREGRMLKKVIRREGIDTGGIVYDAHRPTSVKTRVIAHSQQVVRFDREKSETFSEEVRKGIIRFVRSKIAQSDVIILEDYGKGVIEENLISEILGLAKKYKKPVLVDPKEKNFPLYYGATLITPNRKEAYGGYEFPRKGGKQPDLREVGEGLLSQLDLDAVLITLGEDGMALFEKNGDETRVPTTAREVFDVSGAGDTVIAVLALALASGAAMKEAAVIANLAAGIVVGKLGTATVHPEELRNAVRRTGGKA